MEKIHHLSLSVRGAMMWPKAKLKKLFVDQETGKHLTADQARDYLCDMLSEGKEVLPLGTCEGFDYKKGCPGHEKKSQEVGV